MILADAIVTCLRELKLGYLFGVSGANIEHIHDSVYRLGDGELQTVMTKSEFGAAFMADARARTHHTLGVCCATSGGGMMNLAVGVAESFAHSVPVLALVGQAPLAQEGRGGFQDSSGIGATVNAKAMWGAISKYTCKVESADQFWALWFESLTQPFKGRRGPSVMLLPRDVMMLDVGAIPEGFLARVVAAMASKPETALDSGMLDSLWQQLKNARNPVLVLGSGVVRHNAAEAALQFANACGIKVVSTLACPGIFPNNHEHYLGMMGVAGHPSTHQYIEEQADLIIGLGTQLRVMTRATLEAALTEKPLWVVNDNFDEFDNHLNPSLKLAMNADQFLAALNAKHQEEPIHFSSTMPKAVTCFKPEKISYDFFPRIFPAKTSAVDEDVLTQSEAIKRLNRFLPTQGHILFDAGNCAAAAAHFLKMPLDVSNTIALGMGGMGYAIAGAIGAQLGETDTKRTMVFCGDGAFMMTGLEIHTAVDLQLPILWVVFNNSMHGMCVTRQKLYFEGRIEGNTYGDISIAQIASGFGGPDRIWSAAATNPAELDTQLQHYLSHHSHKPAVLELKIAAEEMPPFMPFVSLRAETESAWI